MHLPIALIAMLVSLTGCAVREQAFGCKGLTSDAQSDEFVMTPTSLRFQSVTYSFTAEQNALRIYTQRETGREIEVKPSSGVLERGLSQWQCQRIGLD